MTSTACNAVIIGVDTHKDSHSAVVVDVLGEVLGLVAELAIELRIIVEAHAIYVPDGLGGFTIAPRPKPDRELNRCSALGATWPRSTTISVSTSTPLCRCTVSSSSGCRSKDNTKCAPDAARSR